MTRYEAIVEILREHKVVELDKAANAILDIVDSEYEARYLFALRESQASAFEENIIERKARQ